MAARLERALRLKARRCAALPLVRGHAGRRPHREDEPDRFDPCEGQNEKRRRRYDGCTGMHDGLAKRAFHRAMVDGRLCRCRRLFRRGFGGAAQVPGQAVDVRLRDIALQRQGERRDEHDKVPRPTDAPDSRMSHCGSRHETCDRSNSAGICYIRHDSAIGRPCVPSEALCRKIHREERKIEKTRPSRSIS